MTSNNVEMNAVADSHVKTVNSEKKEKCFRSCSNAIIHGLERAFGKLGGLIARNTVITIVVSLGICLLFLIGLIETYEENRPEKLWVSSESDSLVHSAWFSANYPPEIRICHIIVQNDNLLTPAGLDMLCTLHEGVLKISKNDSKTPNLNWKTKCFSPANNGICLPSTILNVWNSNCTHIRKLNQQQILTDVNAATTNPMLVSKLGKINLLIGGLTEDNNKKIEKAAAARMTYFLKNEEVYQKDQGRRVDVRGNVWEEEFVSFVKNKSSSYSGSEISYYSLTSQRSDSGDAVGGDLILLALGYVLIIVYLAVMLGSFSRVSHKVWLAICGVVVIGLSFGVSYGLSSAFQLMISPVHNVLPFLLLGIGVDDVFVIIRTWGNINNKVGKDTPTVEKITLMMQHAGVSILVTSFTDVCAFLIGATTVLPALRSFCVYAGIGIIAVFILTCTFFVAWLTLDSRREKAYRDACCCCIQYNSTEWSPMECADKDYLQLFMKNVYSRIILSLPGRITVLIVFAGLIAGGAYGLSELKQDFDPDWFLPSDSMTIKFKIADEKYFPDGVKAAIFVGKVDYFAERNKLTSLYDKISKDKYVVDGSTISWYQSYSTWLNNWVYESSPSPSAPLKFLKIKAEYKVSFNYRTTANKNYFAIDPSGTRSPEEGLQIYFPANGSLVKVNIPITVNKSYFVEFIQEKVGDEYQNAIRANNSILYTTINTIPGTPRTVLWSEKSDPLNAAVISDMALYYKRVTEPSNENEFYTTLGDFLKTAGARFKSDIKFDNATSKIKASRIRYTHIKLDGAREEIRAMDSMQDIAKSMKFDGFDAFAYVRFYVSWETNKIIGTELIRNLILAGVVVLVVTLFLLADLAVSFMVLMCMVLTLVDIAGYMHFWGATVDTVTTILLVLAIGLSVDYSAHIAHGFMACREGNRVERARSALIDIGPAVFHGGFSTFLAFVCLAGSKSYVFSTFFKLFFLVVVFGMFHGLVFLPVVLSFIGSRPYAAIETAHEMTETNNVEPKSPSSDNAAFNSD